MKLTFVSLRGIMDKYRIAKIVRAVDRLALLECFAKRRIDIGERDVPIEAEFTEKHIKPILRICAEPCQDLGFADSLHRIEAKIRPILGTPFMTAGGVEGYFA